MTLAIIDMTTIKGRFSLPYVLKNFWKYVKVLKYFYFFICRGFTHTASSVLSGKPWSTKLSSAGLVYCHFGREIIKQFCPDSMDEKEREAIFDYVYDRFIQEVDAIDNGVSICDGEPRLVQ